MSEETVDIPLRNKHKEIVGYAIISKNDEEMVLKHKWYLINNGKNKKTYVQAVIKRVPIRLHQFIIGKANKGNVIDHINGNGLNNTRINLRHVNFSLNNQNKIKRQHTSSKYIGVSLAKTSRKYVVYHKGIMYGHYINEEEAAKIYDSIALILSNGVAKTNNLVTYEEVKYKTIDEIVSIKRKQYSYINKYRKSYYVSITYNAKRYYKYKIKTLDEAINYLQIFKNEIKILKEKEKQRILNLPIVRNKENIAIIYAYNNKKEIVGESLVDDDKWHELYQIRWYISEGYFKNSKNNLLHRYLMSAKKNDLLVDHINKNILDNRISNLRFNTFAGNIHNKSKIKNATSKYYGVYWHDTLQYWTSELKKNNIRYLIGYFHTEEEAAAAYNVKAREVYGEFANLNILENEQELLLLTIQRKISSSKYRGVYWNKEKEKWKTKLNYKTKEYNIGYYESEIEAASAYNVKVREICPNEIHRINIIENEDEVLKFTANKIDNKSSKYRGVSYNNEKKKYAAYITYKKKTYKLGYFIDEVQAAKAYNNKAFELHGKDYKHFNII